MKILVLGYTLSGKSTVAEMLANILSSSYANTSDKIIEDFAASRGLTIDFVKENKNSLRDELFKFGRAKQAIDPLYPQKEQLLAHDILTGLRNPNEIETARQHKLYDLIIWIDRPGCNQGSTDKLKASDADIVVINDGTIDELRQKLLKIVRVK